MAITAAQLVANVSVEGAVKAATELEGVGGVITGLAAVSGAALIGLGAQSVKMAGDFQSGMVKLTTTAGESKANLKLVSDGILNLATQTGTSTQQLSDAMYHVESAGFHGAQGLNVLKMAAQAAKAENADLVGVSNALVGVMNSYHIPANQAANAMNGIVAAVAGGNMTLQELSSAMSQVAPQAAALHIPFEQVAGAIDVMTMKGMSAQQAAQNLAHVLVGFAAPNAKAADAMKSVGLSAQQVKDALVNQGLPEALQLIEDHVGKQFPASSVEYSTKLKDILGGLVGFKLAAQLTGQSLKDTEGHIKDIGAAMKGPQSQFSGWADVQNTFNVKMAQAQEVIETTGIRIGTVLLPFVSKAIDAFMQFSTWLGSPAVTNFASSVGASIATVFSNIMKAMNSPFMKSIIKDFQDMGMYLGSVFQPVLKQLEVTWNTQLLPSFKQLMPALVPIGQFIGGILVVALGLLIGVITGVVKAFASLLSGAVQAIGGVVQFFTGVTQILAGVLQFWFDIFHGNWSHIASDLGLIWTGITNEFKGFGNIFMGIAGGVLNAIGALFSGFIDGVIGYFTHLYDTLVGHSIIPDLVNGMINWFKMLPEQILQFIQTLVQGAIDKLNSWQDAWTVLKNSLGTIWSGIVGVIKGGVNSMIDTLNLGINALSAFVDGIEKALDAAAGALGMGSPIPITTIPNIPKLASGTDNHQGGVALVGEQGPELALLPKGTAVIPAGATKAILNRYAGGTNDWLANLTNWVTGGVSEIVNNIMKGINLSSPVFSGSIDFAKGITSSMQKWVTDWVQKNILSKIPGQGGSGASAGPGTPVNIPGDLASWIMSAIGLTGVPASWANDLGIIAMHESGGNPNAINNWDINAQEGHPSQGIMQTIPSTFAAYMVPGHGNILNPIDNIAAAIGYIKSRYGSVFNVPGIVSMANGGPYEGYANGTNNAPGGLAWVGEKGPELMYVPKGASITPNNQINQIQQPIIHVHPAAVYLDGRILATALMPYQVDAIRSNTGYRQ